MDKMQRLFDERERAWGEERATLRQELLNQQRLGEERAKLYAADVQNLQAGLAIVRKMEQERERQVCVSRSVLFLVNVSETCLDGLTVCFDRRARRRRSRRPCLSGSGPTYSKPRFVLVSLSLSVFVEVLMNLCTPTGIGVD
jgi:hypothetical protein